MPVWVLAYTYGAQIYQVIVNGYTGKIAGKHPLSWVKITFAVIAAIILIVIIIAVAGHHSGNR